MPSSPSSPTPIPLSDSQARLAAYEAMTRALQQEYQDLTQRLESLRAHNKTRSAQFRELLGQKLILSAQLARLKAWGLL